MTWKNLSMNGKIIFKFSIQYITKANPNTIVDLFNQPNSPNWSDPKFQLTGHFFFFWIHDRNSTLT